MDNLFAMAGAPAPAKDPLASEVSSALGTDRNQDIFSELSNEVGVGTEPASAEEEQALSVVLDGIEAMIHGPAREGIIETLNAGQELWLSIATLSQSILEGAYTKMAEQGVELEPEIWLGENGAVQTTVEMVYEIALASGAPNASDSNQLDMAYLKTVQMIGEDLFEDDDVAAAEAQQAMIDMEFGDGASDIAAEAFNEMEFGGSPEDAMFAEDMMAMPGMGEMV